MFQSIAIKYAHDIASYEYAIVGACAIDAVGDYYILAPHDLCIKSDAVLFSDIG